MGGAFGEFGEGLIANLREVNSACIVLGVVHSHGAAQDPQPFRAEADRLDVSVPNGGRLNTVKSPVDQPYEEFPVQPGGRAVDR